MFVDHCTKAAVNRLLIQHHWSEHPEARDVTIERPIDVIALPRSGSTHLENLVGADRRLRHLPVYVAAQPVPVPGEEPGPDGIDPRWKRADARWQMMRQNEIMAAMHEHSPDHACGENELQIPDFASYQWEWMAAVPGFRDHYLAHDQTPHYRYMRDVLATIASQFPSDRRWMLKSNQHSEQLGPLLATYPDVTVVMIHRDPVSTLQSLLTMRGLLVKSSQKQPDIDAHVDYWVDRIERMLRSYVRDRALVPGDQLVELMFEDIVADDVGAAAARVRTGWSPRHRRVSGGPRGVHGRRTRAAGTVGSSTTSKATSGSTPTRSGGGSVSTPTSSGSGPRPGRTAPGEAAAQRAHRQGRGRARRTPWPSVTASSCRRASPTATWSPPPTATC